jgi:hypothetical protein
MKRLKTIILVSLVSFVPSASAYAWDLQDLTDDFGDRRVVIQTFFISGVPQFDNPDNFDFSGYESSLMGGLMVRCQERKFSVFIPVSKGISFDEPTIKTGSSVPVKFNGGSPTNLGVSSNETNAIFFNDPRSLFAKLIKSKSFAVKVNTRTGIPFAANWNVTGLAKFKSNIIQAGCKV